MGLHHIPLLQGAAEGSGMHRADVGVEQASAVQLTQDAHDAARAMHIFHVVFLRCRRYLGEAGHTAREAVDVLHGEVDASLAGSGQQVQHRVAGAAHGDVQRHGVFEGLECGDIARQHRGIILLVVALAQFDGKAASAQEQLFAIGVGGEQGAVAGQREAQGFGQAVHRVGGEHAGTGTAGGAGGALHLVHFGIGVVAVAGFDHRVDQIHLAELAVPLHLAGFHRAAGNEDHGDVEAHRRHQHAWGDLVAVGDAHHGIGAVAVHHVFHAVGDQVAAGQRIQHAAMAHGDAVIDGNGVELLGHAAGGLDLAGHHLAQILEVHMAGHELGEGVHHGDDGLAEIAILHAGGAPQGAGAGHVAAVGRGAGTVVGHGRTPGTCGQPVILGPVHAMPADRVGVPSGWMQGGVLGQGNPWPSTHATMAPQMPDWTPTRREGEASGALRRYSFLVEMYSTASLAPCTASRCLPFATGGIA